MKLIITLALACLVMLTTADGVAEEDDDEEEDSTTNASTSDSPKDDRCTLRCPEGQTCRLTKDGPAVCGGASAVAASVIVMAAALATFRFL